jgi:hypothetical protein
MSSSIASGRTDRYTVLPSAVSTGRSPVSSTAIQVAIIAVIFLGIILRVAVYVARRPLWSDEAMLSLNIASRSFLGLLRPLQYDQTAPILFLWAEHIATRLGGVNEYVLRLLPLISGVGLLITLWLVARRLLGEREALVATTFVALSTFLIYHSSEVKQYGTDAFVTVVLLAFALAVLRDPASARAWRRLTVAGIVALLLSQPSVFVLAGIGAALVVTPAVRTVPGWMRRLALASVLWVAIFTVIYFVSYMPAANAYMQRFWGGSYLTIGAPDFRFRVLHLAANVLVSPFMPARQNGAAALFALAFAGGVVTLAARRQWTPLVLLLAPIIALVAASVVGKYPVASRVLLFLAPLVFMIYGAALAGLADLAPARWRSVAFTLPVAALFLWRGPSAVAYVVHSPRIEDSRELIASLERQDAGAPVYVYSNGVAAWVFYTTDWNSPDTERLRWMARMASSTGPAFGGRPSRGRLVQHEGDSLTYDYRGRREILGVGSGAESLNSTDRMTTRPDPGWAENEVRRLLDVARPYGWVFIAAQTPSEVSDLFDSFTRAGATIDRIQARNQALIYRVRRPETGSLPER